MKRIFILSMISILFLLAGCSSEDLIVTSEYIYDPPILQINFGEEEIKAHMEAYTWESGDTECYLEGRELSESHHDVPLITTSQEYVTLSFSIEPDVVSCRFWRERDMRQSRVEKLSIDDNKVPLVTGGGVYEITATWNTSDDYRGQATYLFQQLDPEELLYPPELTVTVGNQTLSPGYGGPGWSAYDEHGNIIGGYVPEMVHTLECFKLGKEDLVTAEHSAELEFQFDPDEYTVICWPEENIGDVHAQEIACDLNDHVLTLNKGGYIYQVKAKWTRPLFGGNAYYSFYITVE